MIYVEDGMHYTEAGERSYFARFDTDAVVDGTGTFHAWMRHGDEVTPLTADEDNDRPGRMLHVSTPVVSPDGNHVIVTAEIPGSASVHDNRHGGKGVYTDLWRFSKSGRRWDKLTSYANNVSTPWFYDTPAGALIPRWIGNDRLIWTQMIGYNQQLFLGVREIVIADFVDPAVGQPALVNRTLYQPGWQQGARFYEVWDVKDDLVLLCSDLNRQGHAFPGIFLWQIGTQEMVPLSSGNPNDWEEQALFIDDKIVFMSTAGLGYNPNSQAGFWSTLQTDLHMMDLDGTHRERLTFINDPGSAQYEERQPGDAVRILPYSKTRFGMFADVVRNRQTLALHGESKVVHLCLQ